MNQIEINTKRSISDIVRQLGMYLIMATGPLILLIYFPDIEKAQNWHLLLFYVPLIAIGSFVTIKTNNSAMTFNCGITISAILLNLPAVAMYCVIIEAFIISFSYYKGSILPIRKLLVNLGNIITSVFISICFRSALQMIPFLPIVVVDFITCIGYWIINMSVCACAVALYRNHSPIKIFQSMSREGSGSTYILLLMLGFISVRLYQLGGFAGLIPMVISIYILSRELKPRKLDLETLHKPILNKLRNTKTFAELKTAFLKDIVTELCLIGAAIVIGNPEKNELEFLTYGSVDLDEIKSHTDLQRRLISLEINKSYVVVPVRENSYLIVHGLSKNTKSEKEWLQVVSNYLGITIDNLRLIGQLSSRLEDLISEADDQDEIQNITWLRNSITQALETERSRIASDLHDDCLQDFAIIKQRLGNMLLVPSETNHSSTIRDLIEHIDIINTNIRYTAFKLSPILDEGLKAALNKLIKRERDRCTFDIFSDFSQIEEIENFYEDQKLDLFRIIQELLQNAKKHMSGSAVHLQFLNDGQQYLLRYKDDGTGLQGNSVSLESIESRGMGLRYLRNRVKKHNWGIEINNSGGLNVIIKIPLTNCN